VTDQAGPSVGAQVDTLEAKGLIRVATYRPELEYLFRHWLVQDAAYGSLLKQERRALHQQVGDALEALYPDRLTELAGMLAMHFEQAGDADRAIGHYLVDARYALDRNAIREAYAAADAAARLMGPSEPDESDARQAARVEVAVLRARSSISTRSAPELIAELEAVEDIAGRAGPELESQVHLWLLLVRQESGLDPADPTVLRSTERLRVLSEVLGDPGLAALPTAMIAMNQVNTGPVREGVEALEATLPLIRDRRDFVGGAFARGYLAIGYAELGEFDRALEAAEKAKQAAASGDLIGQLDAQIAEAMVHSIKGDLDRTVPLAMVCIDQAGEAGATACAMVSNWVLGDVFQRGGRYVEADRALRQGLDLASGIAEQSFGPLLKAWRRANAALLGELPEHDEDWDELVASARMSGNHLAEAGILLKRAETRTAQQRWDDAFADYEAAATIAEAQGARPQTARALHGWGEALVSAGRREDGERVLGRALGLFESMGLDREAGEVSAALAQP
jgi:tetratricopeptide (TPR) repeat protein